MAKKEEEKVPEVLEEVVQEVKEKKGDRESRWQAFLDSAKAQNPVKYAIKEKNGEFKDIPSHF
jgi:translation elongation factor EF-4